MLTTIDQMTSSIIKTFLHSYFLSYLPKGDMTRDQLAQLLLVYIGTAADIIEFFDSFVLIIFFLNR